MTIRYKVCPHCARKRRFYVIPEGHGPNNPGHRWTCSKGHSFWREMTTMEKAVAALQVAYLPRIKEMLSRENPFWSILGRTR